MVSGPYDHLVWIGAAEDGELRKLERVIMGADFEFHLDHEDLLTPEGKGGGEAFTLPNEGNEGAEHDRAFPGFVVVQMHKAAQIGKVEKRVSRIHRFFFAHGANRVLITGFRGFGQSIYFDKLRTPDRTGGAADVSKPSAGE